MTEHASTESPRSRWVTRISIALAAIAALVVLSFIGFGVTVYVVTENCESLHEAVEEGDVFAVRCFLLRGVDVNAREGKLARTPLHLAAERGHREVAGLLIARGADVNAKRGDAGWTPLHRAAIEGHTEVSELLIDRGADVNAKYAGGPAMPLQVAHLFGPKELAELLVAKTGVTVRDNHGWTPLHFAAQFGHTRVAELLIAGGADVNAKNSWGMTPLAVATNSHKKDVAALLRKHWVKE